MCRSPTIAQLKKESVIGNLSWSRKSTVIASACSLPFQRLLSRLTNPIRCALSALNHFQLLTSSRCFFLRPSFSICWGWLTLTTHSWWYSKNNAHSLALPREFVLEIHPTHQTQPPFVSFSLWSCYFWIVILDVDSCNLSSLTSPIHVL